MKLRKYPDVVSLLQGECKLTELQAKKAVELGKSLYTGVNDLKRELGLGSDHAKAGMIYEIIRRERKKPTTGATGRGSP
ncbi:MAG TPA: hypothetical protein VMV00_00335 [Candidatus Baltobacteraceae bacterium]|nr:hypothetical protein [Candidatus Baltobacteraceae bacterium]